MPAFILSFTFPTDKSGLNEYQFKGALISSNLVAFSLKKHIGLF